ncbi:MAG: BatA and WFA domain-containing protein [Chloroflexota bacterium]|nr:BatA and WFA domain-containing protein [Chloroflexota bacterium]
MAGVTLLAPGAAAWLLLVPALIALYMLRPRSIRKPISSLRLWRELPQIDRPRARLRRPPLSLLLLLQALLLLAGGLALMRPALAQPAARHKIIMVDASGSMQTRENGTTRFNQALQEAKRIAGTAAQDRITLLRVGSIVSTICSACAPDTLLQPMSEARPGGGRADWQSALETAAGLEKRSTGEQIAAYAISDGAFSLSSASELPDSLHFVQVGSAQQGSQANRAITAFSTRRAPNGNSGYTAYARVDNMSSEPASVQVSALADTVPLGAHLVDLPAGGHTDITWKIPVGTAKLTASLNPGDALAEDDQAVLFLPAVGAYKVAITSAQPDLYRRALAGVQGLENATAVTATGQTAFTIIEGDLPDKLPAGNLLLINPAVAATARLKIWTSQGDSDNVSPLPVEGAPTLPGIAGGIDLRALLIDKAQRVEPAPWLEPVVQSEEGPLLLAGEPPNSGGRRIVALAFDPRSSNLPKLAAFPLLMANIADWLYPLASLGGINPGASVSVQPGIQVTTPGGQTLTVGQSGVFADTEQPGIYKAEYAPVNGKTVTPLFFSVNMLDRTESDNRPQVHPELERHTQVAVPPITETAGTQQEYWPWLAAAALTLTGAEWLLYCWKRGSL